MQIRDCASRWEDQDRAGWHAPRERWLPRSVGDRTAGFQGNTVRARPRNCVRWRAPASAAPQGGLERQSRDPSLLRAGMSEGSLRAVAVLPTCPLADKAATRSPHRSWTLAEFVVQ